VLLLYIGETCAAVATVSASFSNDVDLISHDFDCYIVVGTVLLIRKPLISEANIFVSGLVVPLTLKTIR